MMTDPRAGQPPPSRRDLPAEQQFWHLWRQGRRPEVRAFLAAWPGLSAEQVAAVVAIDQYERWLTGERIPAEDYLALLPAEGCDQAACDIVYGEYLLREQLGEHPRLDEYQCRFPALTVLLARQVGLHRALADPQEDTGGHPGELPTIHIAPADKPDVGAVVAGYKILGELGHGGMGVVYRARQLSLDREVALKVVRVPTGGDSRTLDRMQREARVTARLSHPHIVTIHDAGQVGDLFYFAMEYVPGIDLHRLVEQKGPLPVARACEYIRQAALGLAAAHEHGIVHRDIKPSNLIVAGGDGPGIVKILDLGLARLAEGPPGQADLTQLGAFMGTPDFIAPEQANDPRSADARSDLYSLGCTFYYILAGHPPFGGDTPLAKLMHHHLREAPAIDQVRPEVPAAVSAIITRLLAKQPAARFQSAAELAGALAGIVQGGSEEVRKASASSHFTPHPSLRPSNHAGGLIQRLTGHGDWVKCVAFSPDGKWLASASLDRSVRLWDVASGQEVWRAGEYAAGVLSLAFSPGGDGLVTGGQDRQVVLWDLAGRRQRWRASGHADNVNAVAFTPDGRHVVSVSHDGTLRLWEAGTGRQLRGWSGHAGPVWGVAITPDGRGALSGGQDRYLRLWDLARGELLATFPEQPTLVSAVAVAPDGRLAASGGSVDGVLRLWDLGNQRELRRLEGHNGRVAVAAFSPNGKRLASGSRDRSLRLWDVGTGTALAVFTGHGHWVSSAAWSPGGELIATGSGDRSVCLWRAPG